MTPTKYPTRPKRGLEISEGDVLVFLGTPHPIDHLTSPGPEFAHTLWARAHESADDPTGWVIGLEPEVRYEVIDDDLLAAAITARVRTQESTEALRAVTEARTLNDRTYLARLRVARARMVDAQAALEVFSEAHKAARP